MLQENDDMDELLRKAAENYPLKTDNADWEKVRLALAAGGFSNEPVKKKNYRSLSLLLLLLPLGWASYHYIFSSSPSDKNVAVNKPITKNDKSSQPISIQNETSAVEKSTQHNAKQTVNLNTGTIHLEKSIRQNINQTANANTATIQTERSTKKNIDQTENSNTVTIKLPTKNNSGNLVTRAKTSVAVNRPSSEEETNEIAITNQKNLKSNQEQNIAVDDKNINTNSKEKTDVAVTTDDTKKNDQSVKKEGKTKKQRNNFLYAGVFAGPDISTVKLQSIKSTGVNKGIVFGYQLNKSLSIETGLAWDKKFYYSEGQYFNTGKIYLPPNAKITNVTGNCKMIEVPLNVKYNVKSSGKTTWSSTVGLSSYFMKQENYSYTVVSTGAPYPYNKSYKESSTYLFSVMNVSAGYNYSLGKVGTLRIEPYVKIPLKGMGIGSLPITSAGVNIGITKRIF